MRRVSRENFRAAVFLWNTPFETPRASSGWTLRIAASACSLSPAAIAASTCLTKVRIRLTRAPLISARRSLRRIRFFACGVFAIGNCLLFRNEKGHGLAAPPRAALYASNVHRSTMDRAARSRVHETLVAALLTRNAGVHLFAQRS